MNIRAKDFFEHWQNECATRHPTLFDNWNNNRVYNHCIFKGENSIIDVIAKQLELKAYDEYYWIDAVLFAECDDLVPSPPRPKHEVWLRRVRVAFEHEHDFDSGLYKEVAHLLITDCDLRVLVAYPDGDDQLGREKSILHVLISGSDRADHISETSSFLFISGKKDVPANSVKWEGYIFRTNGWDKL